MRHREEIERLIQDGRSEQVEKIILAELSKKGDPDRLYLLEKLLEVTEHTASPTRIKMRRLDYIKALSDEGKYSEASKQADILLENTRSIEPLLFLKTAFNAFPIREFIFLCWKIQIGLGELHKADQFGRWYIQLLLSNKDIDGFEQFAKEEQVHGRISFSKYEKAQFLMFAGRQNDLAKLMKTELSEEERNRLAPAIYHELPNLEACVAEILLDCYLNLINGQRNNSRIRRERKKAFINMSYRYILESDERTKGLRLLISYATRDNKINLARALLKLELDDEDKERISSAFGTLGEEEQPPELANEKYDLGEDLFEDNEDITSRIRLLERDIQFLISSGSVDKAKELARQLETLDSENTILMDITKAHENQLKEKHNVRNINEVEGELLEAISPYISQSDDVKDQGITVALNSVEKEVLKENYIEILNSLVLMDRNTSAAQFIKQVDNEGWVGPVLKDKLRFEYIRILNLLKLQRVRDALARTEEIVRTWPVSRDEKVAFLYLMIEMHEQTNRLDLALGVAKSILALMPEHARAMLKVKEFEER